MALTFLSLRDLQDNVDALDTELKITVLGLGPLPVNCTIGELITYFTQSLETRVSELEDVVTTPTNQTLTLTGDLSGSVVVGGTDPITLNAQVPDGALSKNAIAGLTNELIDTALTANLALDRADEALALSQRRTHDQITPSDKWIITHNLGFHPSVTVVDTAGTEVVGATTYLSDAQLEINFSAAMAGKAYLN